jgi:hypothetical protein
MRKSMGVQQAQGAAESQIHALALSPRPSQQGIAAPFTARHSSALPSSAICNLLQLGASIQRQQKPPPQKNTHTRTHTNLQ